MYLGCDSKHRASRHRSRTRSDDSILATPQHSNSDTLGKSHRYHQGQGKSLVQQRCRGAIFPSSEWKLRCDLIFVEQGRIPHSAGPVSTYLYVTCAVSTYLLPADPKGFPSTREASSCDLHQQRQTSPRVRPPLLPGRPEMPAREQGSHNTCVPVLVSLQHLTQVTSADPLPLLSCLHPCKIWKLNSLIPPEICMRQT